MRIKHYICHIDLFMDHLSFFLRYLILYNTMFLNEIMVSKIVTDVKSFGAETDLTLDIFNNLNT